MSYGQNLPWGLQATRSLGASTWNGQVSPYLIQSGYNNNIFRGDPVIVAGTADASGTQLGYLISLYDAGTSTGTTAGIVTPTFGVFDGCSFVTPTATNPIDPASPGRQFWPAGTNTLNGIPAVAYVIDDPDTVFNMQTNFTTTGPNPASLGAVQGDIGSTFAFLFPFTGTPPGYGASQVTGNFITGGSQVALTRAPANSRGGTFGSGTGSDSNNAIMIAISPTPPNPSTTGAQYNNVEVLIQNHQYAHRALARA